MKFFLSLTILLSTAYGSSRNELNRYTELRDKTIIDRALRTAANSSYFEVQLTNSSGMYDLIQDIKGASGSTKTELEKTQAVAEILNKQINVERYLDLNLGIAIPLPEAQLFNQRFLINLFGNGNLGAMQSFENQDNVLNPTTQVYLKMDYRYGISSKLFSRDNKTFGVNLYQTNRKDVYSKLTYLQITQNKEIFSTETLNNTHRFYALDFSAEKRLGQSFYFMEIQELKILDGNDAKSEYGNHPMFHLQYRRELNLENSQITPLMGWHRRRAYDIGDGLYLGSKIKYSRDLPFVLIAKLSNKFLTLMQNIELKYLVLSYTFDTAWKNPQEDLWVPPMHSIHLSIPI